MSSNRAKNEKIKRQYYHWLREAQNSSEKTVDAIKKALWVYDEFSNYEDLGLFDGNRAVEYKKWLAVRKHPKTGEKISPVTQYHYLRHLRAFLLWLSDKRGYRSRIFPSDIAFLNMDKKYAKAALDPTKQEYPPLSYVIALCRSIDIVTEIDRRDRALIAFTAISGARDEAISTLTLQCFDEQKLVIYQYKKYGVQTKFAKDITTYLMVFDQELLDYFLDWVKYLRQEKHASSSFPIFPQDKQECLRDNNVCFFAEHVDDKPWSGAGGIRKVFEKRAKAAGMDYYPPHKFRHLAIELARGKCHDLNELKAVSQNFGHENIETTMVSYGNFNATQIGKIIGEIDFQGKNTSKLTEKEKLEWIRKIKAL